MKQSRYEHRGRFPKESGSAGRQFGTDNAEWPAFMLWATVLYLVVSLARPQDAWAVLGLLQPGLVATMVLLGFWLVRIRPLLPADTIVWLGVSFVLAALTPVFFVHNTYVFFWTWIGLSLTVFFYLVILPSLMVTRRPRVVLYWTILLSTAFVAVWALSHGGRGPGGTASDENDVAMALVVGGVIVFCVRHHLGSPVGLKVAWFVALLCLGGVVATASRGGFLALVAAGLAMAIVQVRPGRALGIIAVAAVVIWAVVPGDYKEDMRSISDPTDRTREERLYSWGRAWELFLRNPIVGVGVGNVPWRINEVQQDVRTIEMRKGRRGIGGRAMHSLVFTLLPETGIIGSALYLVANWVALRRSWKASRAGALEVARNSPDQLDNCDTEVRDLARAVFVGIIGFHVAALFLSVLYYPYSWLLLGLAAIVGLAGVPDPRTHQARNLMGRVPNRLGTRRN